MKGLGKILFGFSMATAIFLVYVHERVEMLKVSYRMEQKSSQLSQKSEEFRHLKYEVAQLHSPEYLEKRLDELSLNLTLPKEIQVLQVPASIVSQSKASIPVRTASPHFLDFLGQWIQVAHARTDQ